MTNNTWGDVKFLHYRYYGEFERIGGSMDVPLDYLVSPNGGRTIAYVVMDDGTLRWASAQCAKEDRYNKKYGRAKAAGRLLSRHLGLVNVVSQQQFIAEQDEVHSWAGLFRKTKGIV